MRAWCSAGAFATTCEIPHVGLRTIIAALEDGKVDAATLFEPQYRHLVERGRLDGAAYRTVWRSRPYSHWLRLPSRPRRRSRKPIRRTAHFDGLQLADAKEMMDLEHLRAWIPANETGWRDLVAGVKDAKLEGESWGVTYVVAPSTA